MTAQNRTKIPRLVWIITAVLVAMAFVASGVRQGDKPDAGDYHAVVGFGGKTYLSDISKLGEEIDKSRVAEFLATYRPKTTPGIRYLNRSTLRGTPIEHLYNRTVAVVEYKGRIYAVAIEKRGERRPEEVGVDKKVPDVRSVIADQFAVYTLDGRRIPSETRIASYSKSEFVATYDNFTIVVAPGGVNYEITIKDVEPLTVNSYYRFYLVSWYQNSNWVATVVAAAYFAIDVETSKVTDILPAGWQSKNDSIVATCYTDAPGKAYYSQNYYYGSTQTVAVYANYWCPGSTVLVNYPWVAMDGKGNTYYPGDLPAYKSFQPQGCVCQFITWSIQLPPFK